MRRRCASIVVSSPFKRDFVLLGLIFKENKTIKLHHSDLGTFWSWRLTGKITKIRSVTMGLTYWEVAKLSHRFILIKLVGSILVAC